MGKPFKKRYSTGGQGAEDTHDFLPPPHNEIQNADGPPESGYDDGPPPHGTGTPPPPPPPAGANQPPSTPGNPAGTQPPAYDPKNLAPPPGTGDAKIAGMNATVPVAPPVPFSTSSGTADPTMTPWEVTREQTVAGQLEDLYDRDSPFFEQARQRAIRQSLSGGGQNSAMAGAFGELAAMDTAFKVGFADAATYARSAEFNAAMKNQFSLAEQQFIHNAILSDQSFRQAASLQTQRIAGQFEAIKLDYQGQSAIMDKQLDHWFSQAAQTYEYNLGQMYAQAGLMEGQAGRDFSRTMVLNGMTAMTNFYSNIMGQVMSQANQPGMTPEQSAAAMREGMAWANQQFGLMQSFWGAWGSGGPASDASWLGASSNQLAANWWSFPPPPGTPTS